MEEMFAGSEFIHNTVEEYSNMLLRIAYQNTGNLTDAEDIVQEAFIKFIKYTGFNSQEHIKAWLIRVTVNLCKDLKKSFWKKVVPFTGSNEAAQDIDKSIWDEVFKLSDKYKNVIYLYYYEGYTVPEISEILEEKENTVSSWLTRGRKKLKLLIEE